MKNYIYALLIFALSFIVGIYSYKHMTGEWLLTGIFMSGFGIGIFIMFIKLNIKNNKINTYRRKIEIESINSDESTAKIKVLESKIQVLEKALDNALKK